MTESIAPGHPEPLEDRRRRALGPSYRLFYDEPLHPVRGYGVWLIDNDGRRYLDAYNNVPCIGHAHPRVVRAIAEQAARLNTHTRYLDDQIVSYAERLKATLPDTLDRVLFTCSGSEANDLALRIARSATGGVGIVATDHAYHGGTFAVSEFSAALGRVTAPHVRTVLPPGAAREDATDPQAFAHRVQTAFRDLEKSGFAAAMLIFDTIFSSDGVFIAAPNVLRAAAEAARNAGALVVADEVQPGFGRTGDGFWGFGRHAITPDIVTMGKPMGAGYPMAGLALRSDLIEAFARTSRYFNTFGGTPVAAAAGLAVLDVLRNENLQDNARRTGGYLHERLTDLFQKHDAIAQVRGQGLFWGVELASIPEESHQTGRQATRIVNAMRREGVLISTAGARGDVLKIRPPLPFDGSHVDLLVDALDKALHDCPGGG